MHYLIPAIFLFISLLMNAQKGNLYKPANEIVHLLDHTKLKLKPDFEKEEMAGEAWITAKPYFYSSNSIVLNAKAMLIHEVKTLEGQKLKYVFKNDSLHIDLGKTYKKGEQFGVYVKYTARPKEVKDVGGAAITDAKGLYFIDPRNEDPEKPTQLWTQGEPISNSVWFPTIDSPNQKTSQEIILTVPKNMTTLSNGLLLSQKENQDNTRTDHWKQTQKHAPYLFFIGVGEFAIIKDKWKNKSVDYYVEKEFEPYAKEIFGLTPEMISFFSQRFGFEFIWDKYAQIICRDYVSGAMENTTAVIHAENANQKHGQLVDENVWEDIIAHELAHHWFGDLVTTESWANITVNESFANYSEYLWREFKYGLDHADAKREEEMEGYLKGNHFDKNLVRFHYEKNLDLFDAVSYNKGGMILHMLRNYLGNEAFFAGLEKYLKDNQFGTGEAHQLRLALESVSGKDLNWFFTQWYYGNGHPKLEIHKEFSSSTLNIKIKQTQTPLFEFPLAIDVYAGSEVKRHTVWIKKQEITEINIQTTKNPDLVLIDAEKSLLAEISESKSIQEFIFQYKNAKRYLDRKHAIENLAKEQLKNKEAAKTLILALNDKYFGIRKLAISLLDFSNKELQNQSLTILEKLALEDPKTLVKSEAISALNRTNNKEKYTAIFENGSKSESFAVAGKSLDALYQIDKKKAMDAMDKMNLNEIDGVLLEAVAKIAIENNDLTKIKLISKIAGEYLLNSFKDVDLAKVQKKGFDLVMKGNYLEETNRTISAVLVFYKRYNKYSENVKIFANKALEEAISMKKGLLKENNSPEVKKQIEFIEKTINEINSK
jgi:aminopeptidase N